MQEYGRISQGWKRQARTPLFVGFGGKGGKIRFLIFSYKKYSKTVKTPLF
jgi:hypothetical protein